MRQAKLALVNDELKGLKRRNVHDHDGSGCGEGNEVQRQQLRMTSIVANKIRDAFDRLADLTKQRDMLIADLEHKFHSIEEVSMSSVEAWHVSYMNSHRLDQEFLQS